MAVVVELTAAVGADLVGEVEAREDPDLFGGIKVGILTVGAPVVGGQGVDLGDARQVSDHRGSHRASGAHEVALGFGVGHQLLGDHVQHREAVFNNGRKLTLQAILHDGGEGVAVAGLGGLVADALQILVGTLHLGVEGTLGEGADAVLDHVGNEIGVGDHHLKGLLLTEVGEFLQHLLGGAEVEAAVLVKVLELHARLQYLAVHVVLGVKEVSVAGGHHGLAVLLAQGYHLAVEIPQLLIVLELALGDHEAVVDDGLDLQVIVELDDLGDIRVGAVVDDGPHQLSRLAGRADDETLAVLLQLGLGDTGVTAVVF